MAHVHTGAIPSGKPETKVGPGRNERRKARTRGALLAAGQRLFGEQGFDATTVAEIADAADVAIGSFYNYFDTKDELLAALLYETLPSICAAWSEAHDIRIPPRRSASPTAISCAWPGRSPSGRGCWCAWTSPTA